MRHWVHGILEEAITDRQLSCTVWESVKRIARIVEESEYYIFRTQKAEDISEEIHECNSINDVAKVAFEMATSFRFQHGTFFLLKAGPLHSVWKNRVATSLPERWLRHYKNRNYQFIDPVILKALTIDEPTLITRASNDSPATISFWNDANEYGIGSTAFCARHVLKSGAIVGFSMAAELTNVRSIHDLDLDLSDIVQLVGEAAEAFEAISAVGANRKDELSSEELQFLRSALLGGRIDGVIEAHGARYSAHAVQSNIARKLGVDNILQAIAIATSRGWFDDLAYSEGEVSSLFANLPGLETLLSNVNPSQMIEQVSAQSQNDD